MTSKYITSILVAMVLTFSVSTGCAAEQCIQLRDSVAALALTKHHLPRAYVEGEVTAVLFQDSNQQSDVQVVGFSRIWRQRETKRLVLFDRCGDYLGNYGVNDLPTRLESGKVVFPYASDAGNEIDLTQNPPDVVRLDGEMIHFERSRTEGGSSDSWH